MSKGTAQVIEALIGLAKDMREASRCWGSPRAFTDDEVAFYDALEGR